MARLKLVHRCTDCGASHPKWAGRCPACSAWNSLVEQAQTSDDLGSLAAGMALVPPGVPAPIGNVSMQLARPRPSGITELDRALGGGFVPGSVTLLGGEPGIGKSTLLLQLLANWGGRTLYVSAEESAQQVRLRAERLDAVVPDLWLVAETSLPNICDLFDQLSPELVVIDSIQTVADPALSAAPGSVGQVRGCAHRLVQEAKRRDLAVVLVGHVTKDGGLAGPRVLEHLVDTVISFEGEHHHALRVLRVAKHRFGPTNELGLFEMTDRGLASVPDPSQLFLADRRVGVAGSTVFATMQGQRPLLVEVQALTVPSRPEAVPRRSAQGLDPGRLGMLLAVVERRTGWHVGQADVYASAVGGVKLTEPGADLAVCLAIASALANRPLAADLVVCAEVGLGGELRQVAHTHRRLAEAARLGFRRAIVAESAADSHPGLIVTRAPTLLAAIQASDLIPARPLDCVHANVG